MVRKTKASTAVNIGYFTPEALKAAEAEKKLKVKRKLKITQPIKTLNQVLIDQRTAKLESQGTFWTRFGVTQSGGSRYESGRDIPKPVQMLCRLYLDGHVTDEHLLNVR